MTQGDAANLRQGLPSHKVWRMAGMPPSTLNYWVQTGLVSPSLRKKEGRRVEYWWTPKEAVVVCTIRELRQAGATLGQVRKAKRLIEQCPALSETTYLHWDGRQIGIEEDAGQVTSTTQPGQLMFRFDLPIGRWYNDAAEEAEVVDIAELRDRRRARDLARRLRVRESLPVREASTRRMT